MAFDPLLCQRGAKKSRIFITAAGGMSVKMQYSHLLIGGCAKRKVQSANFPSAHKLCIASHASRAFSNTQSRSSQNWSSLFHKATPGSPSEAQNNAGFSK